MNIIDYLKINGHKNFSKLPFNEVDALILAQLSYLNYNSLCTSFVDVVDSSNLNAYETSILLSDNRSFTKEEDAQLIREVLSNKRYKGFKFGYYINDHDKKQFGAITFIFKKFVVVSYMGTDTSIVGWKEDFSLSYLPTIPSQIEGLKYLEKVALLTNLPIILTGHSKGGNIAMFSGCNANENIKNRILKIYSFDAPGFSKEFLNSKVYLSMLEELEVFIPESSVIGLILYPIDKYQIVGSNKLFMFQHNPYNWLIDKTGFVYKEKLSKKSVAFAASNKQWIEKFSDEEKKILFENIFSLFEKGNITSFLDLRRNWKNNILKLIENNKKISKENKEIMIKMIKSMISIYLSLLFERKKY